MALVNEDSDSIASDLPEDFFENLPDVVLMNVFKFLPADDLVRAGRVCSKWYRLSKVPFLWKQVTASERSLPSDQVEKFISILPGNVHHLKVRGEVVKMVPLLPQEKYEELRMRCPELQSLILEEAMVGKDMYNTVITAKDLPQKLTCLSLRKSFFHPEKLFSRIKKDTLPKIKVLDCSYCWCVRDSDVQHFTCIIDLEEIYLTQCPVTDIGISTLKSCMANLKVLDLEKTYFTERTVVLLAEQCKSLEKLFLGRTAVKDHYLCLMTKSSFPKLRVLCLSGTSVGKVGITAAILCLRSLKVLLAVCCKKVDSNSQNELRDMTSKKQNFKIIFSVPVAFILACNHFNKRCQEY